MQLTAAVLWRDHPGDTETDRRGKAEARAAHHTPEAELAPSVGEDRPTPDPAPSDPTPPPLSLEPPRTVVRDATGFPCGWCLAAASWPFHRSLWRLYGVHLPIGEYGHLVRQCAASGLGEWLARDIVRVALRDGCALVVGARHGQPLVVLPDDDWQQHLRWAAFLPGLPRDAPRRVWTEAQRERPGGARPALVRHVRQPLPAL